jgi:predicted DNA-binding transcriptional regulator YafY
MKVIDGNKAWQTRWDLLLRYRTIEIIALWEGRLTTNHLCDTFGIGRQQASKDINTYNNDCAPGNLEYDKTLKGYKPSKTFKPVYTSGNADEYLHLLNRNDDLSQTFSSLPLSTANTEVINAPARQLAPALIRNIVQAARQCRRIDVDYVSLVNPDHEGRVIVPHTLVFTGLRWHVRGWCEKNSEYRDFVLSRFRGVPELMDLSGHTVAEDLDWHTDVEVRLVTNAELNKAQRQVVAEDYGMVDGKLAMTTRGPLVQYLLQELRVEPNAKDMSARSQPIVVSNRKEISRWLFA